MIARIRDVLAPVKKAGADDRGYRRLLRWAALPVTDRRWAAPLSALALGFGLFAGVAIGPGASGTFAGGVPQIIEIPSLIASSGRGGGTEEIEESSGAEAAESFGEDGEESAFEPVVTETGFEAPEEEAETPVAAGPPAEEEPSEAEQAELAGTVVHVNTAAGSYTVAESGGVMSTVHAGKLPMAGVEVEVPIETLANGTLGEAGKRAKSGKSSRAKLAGIVTAVDPAASAPSYAVSNRGSSVLVRLHPDPAGAVPALPVLGAYISVAVEIETKPAAASSSALAPHALASPDEPPVTEPPETEPPAEPPIETPPATAPPSAPAAAQPPACAPDPNRFPAATEPRSVLWQRQASGGGAPYLHSDFAGIVTAICPDTGQLMLSADDIRESGRDLLFSVPAGIDTGRLTVGDSILASADIGADGTLSLKGLAGNQRRKGAEDAKAAQGDLVPKKKDAKAGE